MLKGSEGIHTLHRMTQRHPLITSDGIHRIEATRFQGRHHQPLQETMHRYFASDVLPSTTDHNTRPSY